MFVISTPKLIKIRISKKFLNLNIEQLTNLIILVNLYQLGFLQTI